MVIGITGKIGAGKSTVTNLVALSGWKVVDADKIGEFVVTHNHSLLEKLAKEFGHDILINHSILRREVLRERAFKNKNTTRSLNKIVHPYLLEELFTQVKMLKEKNENIIIDAALLLDWNLDKKVDTVILVHANLKLRCERMIARGFTKKTVLEIDKQQKSFQELRKRSKFLIYNSGTEKDLQAKVDRLIKKLY